MSGHVFCGIVFNHCLYVTLQRKSSLNRYHSQQYVNGTLCDLTGRPRKSEVRVCAKFYVIGSVPLMCLGSKFTSALTL